METSTAGLSVGAIKALRTADTICFDHMPGNSGIRAIYREPETTVRIPVRRTDVVIYDGDGGRDFRAQERAKCFASVPGYVATWKTIAALLKPGDELVTRFVESSNGYLERSTVATGHGSGERLHHDKLELVVYRKGEPKYTFHVTDSTCPANSARMIRV